MILYKNLTAKEDNYDAEDIIITNSYKYIGKIAKTNLYLANELNSVEDFELIKYSVVNAQTVLLELCNAGKLLFNKYFEQSTKSSNKKVPTIEQISKFLFSKNVKDETINFYNEWIIRNRFPYTSKFIKEPTAELFTTYNFVSDCLLLYCMKQAHTLIFKGRTIDSDNKLTKLDIIKQQLEDEKIFKKIIIDELNSLLLEPRIKSIGDNIENIWTYEDMINGDDIDINRLMIIFINEKLHGLLKDSNYRIECDELIFNSNSNSFHIYTIASSLIGVAYNRLFHNLVGQETVGMKKCELPGCPNWFHKLRKNSYCEIHRGTPEADRETKRRYEEEHKAERKQKREEKKLKDK